MKTKIIVLVLLTIIGIGTFTSCNKKEKLQEATNTEQPLNITIYLDLSDRLTRNLTPSQMERDTAIINAITNYFNKKTIGPQILKSKNKIRVFFYPTPANSNIATLANDLRVDMEEHKGIERRKALESMGNKFRNNLELIYSQTLKAQNWTGCDIWDFFNSKKVDTYCIRKGYRNILVILTDGYIFASNHKIKQGDAYSYILPQTLAVPNSSLIANRKGLDDLEVRIMEINPYNINHRDKMVAVIEKWLKKMGVKEENITVAETDLPSTTRTIITSFLE